MNEHTTQLGTYYSDQYGSVYKRGEHENYFFCKLNGRSLIEAVDDKEKLDFYSDN